MCEGPTNGTRDEHYDLIFVLFQATHGAWNYDRSIAEAKQSHDEQLVTFFREARDQDARRAERAKQLLAARIG